MPTLLAALALTGFMYRPRSGLVWDPSCLTYNRTTYCYFMYMPANETTWTSGFAATSTDGVHFSDAGAFAVETPGVQWFKCMVHKVRGHKDGSQGAPSFVMNHGTSGFVSGPDDPSVSLPDDRGCPRGTAQCLRFLRSSDLLNWTYMYTLHPDVRWYAAKAGVSTGRWDHAYVQQDGDGGYVALPVATPADPSHPAPGLLRSDDGLNFSVAPPLSIDWRAVRPTGFEVGGTERLADGRYYMLGGGTGGVAHGRYSMFTLRSIAGAGAAGPYEPDPQAYRLSGQSGHGLVGGGFGQGLAAWARNYDVAQGARGGGGGGGGVGEAPTALISQYIGMRYTADPPGPRSLGGGGHVWLLPFRQPWLDPTGHLHLVHWAGNEALKGAPLPPPPLLPPQERRVGCMAERNGHATTTLLGVQWLEGSEAWDHTVGVVVEGTLIQAPEAGSAVGIAFEVAGTAAAAEVDDDVEAGTGSAATGQPIARQRESSNATTTTTTSSSSSSNTTVLLIDIASAESADSAQLPPATRVYEVTGERCLLRDETSAFACGGGSEGGEAGDVVDSGERLASDGRRSDDSGATPIMCRPATVNSVPPGTAVPFLLYARLGIFELYVGGPLDADAVAGTAEDDAGLGRLEAAAAAAAAPLRLVQTLVYGLYPIERARVGLAMSGGSVLEMTRRGPPTASPRAWKMSLSPGP